MACRQCHPAPCCTVLAKAVSNSPSVLAFNTFKLRWSGWTGSHICLTSS